MFKKSLFVGFLLVGSFISSLKAPDAIAPDVILDQGLQNHQQTVFIIAGQLRLRVPILPDDTIDVFKDRIRDQINNLIINGNFISDFTLVSINQVQEDINDMGFFNSENPDTMNCLIILTNDIEMGSQILGIPIEDLENRRGAPFTGGSILPVAREINVLFGRRLQRLAILEDDTLEILKQRIREAFGTEGLNIELAFGVPHEIRHDIGVFLDPANNVYRLCTVLVIHE